MSPLEVGIVCAAFAGVLTICSVWAGVRWSSRAAIDEKERERRHLEASAERAALVARVSGLETAVHALELSVERLTTILGFKFPKTGTGDGGDGDGR